jgi:hypothetical protein
MRCCHRPEIVCLAEAESDKWVLSYPLYILSKPEAEARRTSLDGVSVDPGPVGFGYCWPPMIQRPFI